MLQFSYHKYSLVPRFKLNRIAGDLPREGALFKIQWPDGVVGYGDCFPWPEFGDEPVEKHIEAIRKGKISPLLEQTIWLARKDGDLRQHKKSGLLDVRKIKNHFSVTDLSLLTDSTLGEIKSRGFTTLKLKVGRDVQGEAEWLERIARNNPYLSFRLDFNGNHDFANFEKFASSIPQVLKSHIDFVEDPIPYDFQAWHEASRLLPLAVDFEYESVDWDQHPLPFRTIILKPARQDVARVVEQANRGNLKICVTSSMDHPVGMVHSLRVASELKKLWPARVIECGCLTHHLYWPNDFTKEMIIQGPCLVQVNGLGIGFDQLFKTVEWTPVT